jgi:hypothetical protein
MRLSGHRPPDIDHTPRHRLGVPPPRYGASPEQKQAFQRREREYVEAAKADHARQRAAVLARAA